MIERNRRVATWLMLILALILVLPAAAEEVDERIAALEKEVKALREALEQVATALDVLEASL